MSDTKKVCQCTSPSKFTDTFCQEASSTIHEAKWCWTRTKTISQLDGNSWNTSQSPVDRNNGSQRHKRIEDLLFFSYPHCPAATVLTSKQASDPTWFRDFFIGRRVRCGLRSAKFRNASSLSRLIFHFLRMASYLFLLPSWRIGK